MGNVTSRTYRRGGYLNDMSLYDTMMTDREVEYENGEPNRVEIFTTGFITNNSLSDDKFIVENGKYIYKRYVYPDKYVYFVKVGTQCFAWHYQFIEGVELL
jgi:hypothetical protein